MNKKTFLAGILAVLMTACALTACKPSNPHSEASSKTEESSSMQPSDTIANSGEDFADLLENSLLSERRFSIDFNVRQKHIQSESSIMEKSFFVQLQADASDETNPRFTYAIRKNVTAQEDFLLFYDEGYLFRKENAVQYKYPMTWDKATNGIPFHLFQSLFGDDWKEIFDDASISVDENQNILAQAEIPTEDYLQSINTYLQYFGGTPIQQTDEELSCVLLSVNLDKNDKFISYSVEIPTQSTAGNGTSYPVIYTVSANANPISENFTLSIPSKEEKEAYRESEPEISSITLDDFVRRLALSDQNTEKAVYTKMTTNGLAFYSLSGIQYQVPVTNITEVDHSNPRKPHIAMVETLNFFGSLYKTEVYYTNDMYYYAVGDQKFSIYYPAEEYMANVEASAQEKAEAGISTFFLSEAMLSQAILRVNPDQSVCAQITFDGETQRNNIFYNIKSVFNDDFSEKPNAVISEASVYVTLDRFNDMVEYILEVSVSIPEESDVTLTKYSIQYSLEFSQQPKEIIFPDDLNTENYPEAEV